MNKVGKIIIVVALVILVGVIITLKQTRSSPTTSPVDNNAADIQAAKSLPQTKNTQSSKALPRLVDLGAGRCIPCKMMAPILEELKKEYAGSLRVEVFDVEINPDIAEVYRVWIIPTQIFFDASGKELFRHEGFMSKEDILNKWKQLGVELTKTK